MLNTNYFKPRNLIVIGAIVLMVKMLAGRCCDKLDKAPAQPQ